MLEELFEPLLALLERLLRLLALGDVVDGADHPRWLPLLVEDNLGLAVDYTLLAVRTYYAVFEVVRFATVKGFVYLIPDQRSVIRVCQLHQLVEGGHELF